MQKGPNGKKTPKVKPKPSAPNPELVPFGDPAGLNIYPPAKNLNVIQIQVLISYSF